MNILQRPDLVAARRQFGHWECDLTQFRKNLGKANVTSPVERVSRFAVLLHNNDRQSQPTMDGLIGVLQPLPHRARRSSQRTPLEQTLEQYSQPKWREGSMGDAISREEHGNVPGPAPQVFPAGHQPMYHHTSALPSSTLGSRTGGRTNDQMRLQNIGSISHRL